MTPPFLRGFSQPLTSSDDGGPIALEGVLERVLVVRPVGGVRGLGDQGVLQGHAQQGLLGADERREFVAYAGAAPGPHPARFAHQALRALLAERGDGLAVLCVRDADAGRVAAVGAQLPELGRGPRGPRGVGLVHKIEAQHVVDVVAEAVEHAGDELVLEVVVPPQGGGEAVGEHRVGGQPDHVRGRVLAAGGVV